MKYNYQTQKSLKESNLKFDFVTPIFLLLLAFLGISFIYSAQCYNIDEVPFFRQFWIRQIFFVILGGGVYLWLAFTDYEVLMRHANFIYVAAICLLLPLAIQEHTPIKFPLVQSRFNATRWINFSIFSLQPSELAKIATLIMLASIFARAKISKGSLKSFSKVIFRVLVVFFIPILLIFLQPDLGSTLVFPPMLISMLYLSKLPKKVYWYGTVIGVPLLVLFAGALWIDISGYSSFLKRTNMSAITSASQNAYGLSDDSLLPLKDYQRNRILSFFAPEVVDPKGQGVSWNYRQSLIAVGSGALTGKGHAEGTQAKLGYLPSDVAYNDFIFSVLAEESGFIGGISAIFLLSGVVFGCLRAAARSRDMFGCYLSVGAAAIISTHIFINVGMTIGIMPITGLPLPMLSYGGTFILTCGILFGIVQSVYRHSQSYA